MSIISHLILISCNNCNKPQTTSRRSTYNSVLNCSMQPTPFSAEVMVQAFIRNTYESRLRSGSPQEAVWLPLSGR